ncbi:iron-containing alcohol dehydrogenase [Paraglaciecola psychrophila]|uniref:Iron-containing alcohol dehydrogenase n=1 Tax=Paraglaciecola psychrophila 170 TaxID=1129794 RepID=K7AML3_9ALTE|nr:iron-containing alcohol dehydrogenase [Paraglaciecola psychrophila]AGH44055.1 iron-containing alcohol dehydrogenase [Paraglaciecola psychrophila 170]GAC36625.1 probable alcohol dehydrogenase [Paraglaciecola psychrophila 170]
MKPFIFSTTKSIISEIGAIQRIADICSTLDISKPLIITDQGIVDVGLMQPLDTAFKNAGKEYFCFDQVVADPPEHIVLSAVTYAKELGVDGVIGFGGGSSLDTAKLVALLANSDEQLADIYGVDAIRGKRLPLILIPTTAGTGSEVTPIAIVTTGETTKAGVVSAILLPDIALLDASLTLGLPSHVTAATGIDAMVHAIEAYTSAIKKNPYSDLLAKQALTLLSSNIVEATLNGSNVEARQAMLFGACLAGQAFANSPVAAVHALAYPLGGHFHIPHGLSNALVLVQVMNFNLSHCADLYAELAPSISDTISLDGSNQQIAKALIDFITSLIKQLKLPVSLAAMGVGETDINTLANDAMLQTRLLVNNPKPVTLDDVKQIYRQAHQGTD